jgi:hypothetical protein
MKLTRAAHNLDEKTPSFPASGIVPGYAVSHFINLTNGIQAIQDYGLTDYRFIRLQSTACEQKRWEEILNTLSDDFMVAAALGNNCIVYDYGANKEVPRAVWQGMEWVKFALLKRWHDITYLPLGRAKTCGTYFAEVFASLDKKTKARLDYFGKYVSGPLHISSKTTATDKDSNYSWYVDVLRHNAKGEGRGPMNLA